MPEFRSKPEVYNNSEGIFRMVCLAALLRGQFGVRYNPAKIPEDAPFDTAALIVVWSNSYLLRRLFGGAAPAAPAMAAAPTAK
jgi:hypothetical protein